MAAEERSGTSSASMSSRGTPAAARAACRVARARRSCAGGCASVAASAVSIESDSSNGPSASAGRIATTLAPRGRVALPACTASASSG